MNRAHDIWQLSMQWSRTETKDITSFSALLRRYIQPRSNRSFSSREEGYGSSSSWPSLGKCRDTNDWCEYARSFVNGWDVATQAFKFHMQQAGVEARWTESSPHIDQRYLVHNYIDSTIFLSGIKPVTLIKFLIIALSTLFSKTNQHLP